MLLVAQTLKAIGEFRAVLFTDKIWTRVGLWSCWGIVKSVTSLRTRIARHNSNLSYLYLSWWVPTSPWLLKVTLNTETYYWDNIPCFPFSPFDWLDTIVLWYLPLLRSFKTPIRSDTLDVYLKKESNTPYDHGRIPVMSTFIRLTMTQELFPAR